MAFFQISTSAGVPDQISTQQLDGVAYRVRLRWNHISSTWFLDLSQEDGTPITYGRPLRVGPGLLRQLGYLDEVPPGEIVVIDTTLRDLRPLFDDIGVRSLVLYADASEVTP